MTRPPTDMHLSVTLRDVARLAGVSEITVSRVLRGHASVSPATRQRVLGAVARSGYVPNRLAGSLSGAGSDLVGVVVPSLSNNVFPELMAGIAAALAGAGLQPVVGVSDYDPGREQELVRAMLAWKPKALILTGLDHSRETVRLASGAGLRVVEVMETGAHPIDIAVGFSHLAAGAAIARHLAARGYRRFGYVGHGEGPGQGQGQDHRAARRLQGLREGLEQAGLPPPICAFETGASSVEAGRAGLAALLAQSAPDVVVFSNDDMAVGGVFHCLANGIVIPSGLALFGFNGLEIGQSLPQPLSTLRSHRAEIGAAAVAAILAPRPEGPEGRNIDTGFSILAGATA